jgi:hypothetical protein
MRQSRATSSAAKAIPHVRGRRLDGGKRRVLTIPILIAVWLMTSVGFLPPNRNWFLIEDFVREIHATTRSS